MHDTKVTFKNGQVYCGPLWMFRPIEGWCSLVLDPMHYDHDPPERLYFRDMVSMVTDDQRLDECTIGLCDELAKARQHGWDGT
jgi:hypothetical protein